LIKHRNFGHTSKFWSKIEIFGNKSNIKNGALPQKRGPKYTKNNINLPIFWPFGFQLGLNI